MGKIWKEIKMFLFGVDAILNFVKSNVVTENFLGTISQYTKVLDYKWVNIYML